MYVEVANRESGELPVRLCESAALRSLRVNQMPQVHYELPEWFGE